MKMVLNETAGNMFIGKNQAWKYTFHWRKRYGKNICIARKSGMDGPFGKKTGRIAAAI
jgi:hypothetical protein